MAHTVKRAIDLLAAVILLLALLPLLLAVALLVKATSPGPVLFSQARMGYRGRVFRIWKFRTMVVGAERTNQSTGVSDPRITPMGRWLRRYSIDELPQLWNVLVGEMSLVGPRPAPLAVAERFTAEDRRRLQMRPGLTGLAQVQGRNSLSWRQKIALDCWYVENWSLWLDALILVRTVSVVLSGEGIYGPGGRNRGYE